MYTLEEMEESGQPGEKFLAELVASAKSCVTRLEEYDIGTRAAEASRIRHCIWSGQHYSERSFPATDDDVDPYPFTGASDIRYRLADFLTNQRVAECFNALMRSQVSFASASEETEGDAVYVANLWKDIKTRAFPLEWVVQNLLLANYLHGGGRGVAGMWIGWDERQELRHQRLTMDYLESMWVARRVMDGEDAEVAAREFQFATMEPENGEDSLADILRKLKLVKRIGKAKTAAAELRSTGYCFIIKPMTVNNGPKIRALALGDTLWLDPTTPVANGDDAQEMHLTEWLTASEIRAMATREDWYGVFVDELLGEKADRKTSDTYRPAGRMSAGRSIFPVWEMDDNGRVVDRSEASIRAGKYQIVRSYVMACGEEGVPGRYEVVWSPGVTRYCARGIKLVREAHGGWPVQVYNSEVIGPFALDARAIPELAAGLQSHGKISHDMIANISMMQLPPYTSKGLKDDGELLIEPLGNIRLNLSGEVKFMTPPQVPGTTLVYLKSLERWRDMYFGLPNDEIPAQLWQNLQAVRVYLYLAQSAETVRRVLAVTVEHIPAEALAEYPSLATNEMTLPVQIKCDPREWDIEHIKVVAEVMNNLIMPMNREEGLKLTPLVHSLVLGMLPTYADSINRDPQQIVASEMKDELQNYAMIRNGVRPPVPEGGNYDYAGRAQLYQQMEQANPLVFSDMAPDKLQLLAEHRQALEFQLTQTQNAQTGRSGVKQKIGAIEAR